ncbi:MAG: DNA-3-methyladenine glycosylase 2 family protein [Candidatus Rokubacteria bacterium]|nr:DNA-3-methyladenine glycosylase 2 family protein [Candidatus Rokubacteria bacterium]
MNIVLTPEGPLDVAATLARYRLWGEDPANRVDGDVFRRVLRFEERLVPYAVRWSGPADDARLAIRAPGARGARLAEALAVEVRALFGLDFDLAGFYRFAKGDRVLAGLIAPLYGMRPTLAPTALEMLVGSITAQQLNLTFAFALRARLVRRYGAPVAMDGVTVYAFPAAAALARARPATLRGMQYSTAKTEAIRGVARALTRGELDAAALAEAPNAKIIERLTALRGIGRWTADWFIARCLGRGDVCPAGDLAVRKAFARYYGRGRVLSEDAIRRRAAGWGPYQNLAIHYLLAGMRLAAPRVGGGT